MDVILYARNQLRGVLAVKLSEHSKSLTDITIQLCITKKTSNIGCCDEAWTKLLFGYVM